uniref:rRNA maturation RNase YbeY n=1 Tax=uncultured Planktosalinus sp. TaxID=1810935 RepID=UPI0030DAA519
KEGFKLGEISYVFCDDEYLHKLNIQYLNHDTLTDIISFDYTVDEEIIGDIYISIERVRENAKEFNSTFEDELARVIIHGVLHLLGYKDKTELEKLEMRQKEDSAVQYFNRLMHK